MDLRTLIGSNLSLNTALFQIVGLHFICTFGLGGLTMAVKSMRPSDRRLECPICHIRFQKGAPLRLKCVLDAHFSRARTDADQHNQALTHWNFELDYSAGTRKARVYVTRPLWASEGIWSQSFLVKLDWKRRLESLNLEKTGRPWSRSWILWDDEAYRWEFFFSFFTWIIQVTTTTILIVIRFFLLRYF